MRDILLFLFLCLSITGCEKPEDFVARVQFEMPLKKTDWPELISHLQEIVPKEKYSGLDVEIKSTRGAPDLLILVKTSRDGRFKILVSHRENKENLSVILYSAQSCGKCESIALESDRLERALRTHYGTKVMKNSDVIKIPF